MFLHLYIQLARLQQELQQTQDRLANADRVRLSAERQVKDLEVKLEDLEAQGGKALKNQIKKLEQRVRVLVTYTCTICYKVNIYLTLILASSLCFICIKWF